MCGRSLNIALEEEIDRKKAVANTNWYTNKSDIERESRKKRKENPNE